MSFLWNLINKAKVNEDMLNKNKIPILDYYKLVFYDNEEPLIKSGFGKFYNAIYDGKEILLKVVDISLNENIINEFILWKKYQSSKYFLTLKGVILNYNSAYIIFKDSFEYTLESYILNQKEKQLNEIEKINIAKQILDILNLFQNEKEINGDLRPETFIITSEKKVKLIDFGLLLKIPDFANNEEIKDNRIKYSPPEYLLENEMNISYDIYSFGCILIDLFSTDINKTIILKSYEQYDDYIKELKENKYPIIPDDLNYLLQEIIKQCLNKDSNKRIKINELYFNLNLLLNKLQEYNSNTININEIIKNDIIEGGEQFEKINNLYNFYKEINIESRKYEKIENDLKIKVEKMKKDLDNRYKNNIIELDNLHEKLKKKIEDVINHNKELMKSFYEKTLENTIYFINLLSNSMSDIFDIKKCSTEMQLLISAHNQFINRNKYENIEKVIEPSKEYIEQKVKKYTNIKNFDIIDLSFEKCSKFVHKNEELANNYCIEINKLFEIINNTKNFFGDDDTIIKELDDQLLVQKIINDISSNIQIEEMKKENEEKVNSMTKNIYVKMVENSHMLSIFNYQKKQIKNYFIFSEKDDKHKNFRFNSNCFSLYDPELNYIYISGGIKDINDLNSHDDSFYRIDIGLEKKNRDKNNINLYNNIQELICNSKLNYKFKIHKLCDMKNKRSSHTMIKLSSNKNMILCISGINTDTCEVYNIEYDSWASIQELPMKCQNPGVIDYDNYIIVFPYSKDFNNIYRINLASEEGLIWESIKYSINEGKLKKGIGIITHEKTLYLLGGYDDKGIYSHIYEVDLDNGIKNIDIKLSENLVLPNDIYFSSNFLKLNVNEENENNKFLIMDNYNGVLEFNANSGEFKYYLGK